MMHEHERTACEPGYNSEAVMRLRSWLGVNVAARDVNVEAGGA